MASDLISLLIADRCSLLLAHSQQPRYFLAFAYCKYGMLLPHGSPPLEIELAYLDLAMIYSGISSFLYMAHPRITPFILSAPNNSDSIRSEAACNSIPSYCWVYIVVDTSWPVGDWAFS